MSTEKQSFAIDSSFHVISTSLEINHKSFDIVKKSQAGGGVAVKIEHAVYQSAKMFGRHFDEKDEIYSHITRQSIDVLKVSYRNGRLVVFMLTSSSQASFKQDVSNEEWLLIKALKPVSLMPVRANTVNELISSV